MSASVLRQPDAEAAATLELLGIRFAWGLNGFAEHPAAIARLACRPALRAPPPVSAREAARIAAHLGRAGLAPVLADNLVGLVAGIADAVLARVGAPTASTARARAAAVGPWDIVVPLHHAETVEEALRLAAGLAAAAAADPQEVDRAIARRLAAIERGWSLWRPDVERAEVIAACERRGVRWRRLSYYPDCIQLGEGRRQKRLYATVSGDTGYIAIRIANDKSLTHLRLAQQGVPVPRHRIVQTADEAARAAREYGFPIVIKPRDGKWNRGVAIVYAPEEVVEAFADARGSGGGGVVVESWLPGREFRILVAAGAVCGAHEREPPTVVGDGVSSVAALIEQANADPARTDPPDAWSGPIAFLPLVERCLAWQGLSLDGVPEAGRRVLVNPLPFRKYGATYRDVSDAVHPANAALAVRIARLLELDIAGIDIRLPDIRRPWTEGPAGVCEVNGGPGIDNIAVTGRKRGVDISGRMIDRIFPAELRRPLPFVLYAVTADQEAAALARAAQLAGEMRTRLGWSVALGDRSGVTIAGNRLHPVREHGMRGWVQLIVESPEADAAILVMPQEVLVAHGLGHDRIDVATVADGPWRQLLAGILAEAGTRIVPFDDPIGPVLDHLTRVDLSVENDRESLSSSSV
ncbi:hypothetical protein STAQ_10850 [Allostella sp. ATCC 35155]|nr:hypothetical protein STAQ_10850 [Stella sp. ATCC 35155]